MLNPDDSLGFLVRRAHRRFDRLLNARLSNHDLKTGFWYYLRVLWIEDGVTQKYLSDMTNVTEATTVSLVNGMVDNGLVTRSRSTTDKRKLQVSLTPKGRALESELMHYAEEINDLARKGISAKDLATCADVLRRMSDNLAVAFNETVPADKRA
ncbi:MarR family winged helix-turn-helix transcriptional regulator [Sphingobium xenophagum]|uniref:MarR family winged helix-turn-helix transcriptional regulator n=1 Tax=Sphingobium xenophagum TaxID=121428 RepID=UPI0002EF5AC9|nr:MarR family winged helix-turn-helix transcriptional regulator [Sphingobium xenophagum]